VYGYCSSKSTLRLNDSALGAANDAWLAADDWAESEEWRYAHQGAPRLVRLIDAMFCAAARPFWAVARWRWRRRIRDRQPYELLDERDR
jgi:hypothetical protein